MTDAKVKEANKKKGRGRTVGTKEQETAAAMPEPHMLCFRYHDITPSARCSFPGVNRGWNPQQPGEFDNYERRARPIPTANV
jgi:hypothetical protein